MLREQGQQWASVLVRSSLLMNDKTCHSQLTIKQTKALLDNLRGDSDPFQAAMASSPNQAEDKRISFSGSRTLNSMETSVLMVQIN